MCKYWLCKDSVIVLAFKIYNTVWLSNSVYLLQYLPTALRAIYSCHTYWQEYGTDFMSFGVFYYIHNRKLNSYIFTYELDIKVVYHMDSFSYWQWSLNVGSITRKSHYSKIDRKLMFHYFCSSCVNEIPVIFFILYVTNNGYSSISNFAKFILLTHTTFCFMGCIWHWGD
jgi:hypothetical protein